MNASAELQSVGEPRQPDPSEAFGTNIESLSHGRTAKTAGHLRALRPQHWLKNFLLFVPLLAAHRLGENALLGRVLLGFLAFGCITSSGYLVNDLLDLAADRRHPSKRYRPFASGDLPLSYAFWMIPALVIAAGAIGSRVSGLFVAALLTYLALTLIYSLYLKQIALLDVIALAGLYTLRILAGSAAASIWPSHWLLAFSTLLFLSLALVKRYGELAVMRRIDGDSARARAYQLSDGELLAAMGIASGYLAVLVLAVYINRDVVQVLYRRHELMWALCPLLLYWISHVWLIAHRGQMPDDPVLFAVTDRTSRIVAVLMITVCLLAV
jgi:4-hydroxybenzoate polyprenyltransferase